MSVERKCDCGAMMGAYDLGCKICGKSYKVRDEFLIGKDILPEPPVGLWAAQQREAQSKRKNRSYKPAARRAPSRGSRARAPDRRRAPTEDHPPTRPRCHRRRALRQTAAAWR